MLAINKSQPLRMLNDNAKKHIYERIRSRNSYRIGRGGDHPCDCRFTQRNRENSLRHGGKR